MTHRYAVLGLLSRMAGMLLLCAFILNPCFARKIKTQVGPNANFAAYRTYQWLPPKTLTSGGIRENDPVLAPAIKAAINRELAARGLTEVAEGGDLLVATLALTSYFPQLEAVVFGNDINFMYGTPIATMGRYNKEGTLAVNLIDSRINKYAWAGLITDSIDNKPGSGIKKLPGAAAALFSKCPLKKK
jgi:hypothetical protein